jgi:hypothetical protein
MDGRSPGSSSNEAATGGGDDGLGLLVGVVAVALAQGGGLVDRLSA